MTKELRLQRDGHLFVLRYDDSRPCLAVQACLMWLGDLELPFRFGDLANVTRYVRATTPRLVAPVPPIALSELDVWERFCGDDR